MKKSQMLSEIQKTYEFELILANVSGMTQTYRKII